MPSSPFVGPGGEPTLVDCAVLYVDLLGVSAKARGASAQSELEEFDRTIRSAFPYPLGATAAREDERGAYPASVFSDSVVQAVPILDGLSPASAILQVVQEVGKLQANLAQLRHFARGAVTLGKFHSYDGLLFGPALVEAVRLEQTVAGDPRVVLSPAAVATLLDSSTGPDERSALESAPLLLDEDGMPVVDYLSAAFELDPQLDLPTLLLRHREVVVAELEQQAADFGRWSKHRWVAEYHNFTCAQLGPVLDGHGGVDTFLVTSIPTARSFSPLRRVDHAPAQPS